ncbi:hypothetical protein [Paraflavitalea pollutisoli]|uniref:hypothetical protein n=1 Tax=Paraflavitalea pollutisoli TaxID=3034143 RepID=UPI0023EB401D|nr:hypothetical protein [Paraflavitalea sp. H1-2-19X]
MQFVSTLMSTILCMVLIYALLSLLVSTLTEALNSYFQERSQLLYRTLSKLFEDGINVNFGQMLYSHPMVDNLKKDVQSLPQYISDSTFVASLIDVVANYGRTYKFDQDTKKMLPQAPVEAVPKPQPVAKADGGVAAGVPTTDQPVQPQVITLPANMGGNVTFQRFIQGVLKMEHTPLKLLLMNMIERAAANNEQNPLPQLQKELQVWYNNQMERISGWYKNWIRTRLFYIGLLLALVLNIDSIHLFQTLYRSPDLRAKLEPIAEQLADNYAKLKADTTLTNEQRTMQAAVLTNFIKDSSAYKNDTALQKVRSFILQLDSAQARRDTATARNRLTATEQLDNLVSLGIPIG